MGTEKELEMSSDISCLDLSVNNILGIIYQLLPMHESEFIDIFRNYFHED